MLVALSYGRRLFLSRDTAVGRREVRPSVWSAAWDMLSSERVFAPGSATSPGPRRPSESTGLKLPVAAGCGDLPQ